MNLTLFQITAAAFMVGFLYSATGFALHIVLSALIPWLIDEREDRVPFVFFWPFLTLGLVVFGLIEAAGRIDIGRRGRRGRQRLPRASVRR